MRGYKFSWEPSIMFTLLFNTGVIIEHIIINSSRRALQYKGGFNG